MVEPVLSDDGRLCLTDARHPLLEHVCRQEVLGFRQEGSEFRVQGSATEKPASPLNPES
jgi:hypothetical protein